MGGDRTGPAPRLRGFWRLGSGLVPLARGAVLARRREASCRVGPRCRARLLEGCAAWRLAADPRWQVHRVARPSPPPVAGAHHSREVRRVCNRDGGLHPFWGFAPGAGGRMAETPLLGPNDPRPGCTPAHRDRECGALACPRVERAGAGARASGARGESAPGSGVCTRRGGGIGRCAGRVCTRFGGLHPPRGRNRPDQGSQPPRRVQTPIPGAQLPSRRRSQPPSQVQTPATGAPSLRGAACKPPQRVHRRFVGLPANPRNGCTVASWGCLQTPATGAQSLREAAPHPPATGAVALPVVPLAPARGADTRRKRSSVPALNEPLRPHIPRGNGAHPQSPPEPVHPESR